MCVNTQSLRWVDAMISVVAWGNTHQSEMNALLTNWPQGTRQQILDRLTWAAADSGQKVVFTIPAQPVGNPQSATAPTVKPRYANPPAR